MKKQLFALAFLLALAAPVHAQNATTLPYAAAAVADIGNGPIKVRVVQGNASVFTSQSSGVGSTSGSSTALTLTVTPSVPPVVGGLISGNGITSGTTVAAYNGTTGVTLSAAMTVPASTPLAWGAACPASAAGIPTHYIPASVMADYYLLYTQARVCAVSPGGPANTLLTLPVFYDQTTPGGGSNVSFANPTATAGPAAINGSATTAMRSDAAPAVQLGTAAQKGILQGDNATLSISSGVIGIALGHANSWLGAQNFSLNTLTAPTPLVGTVSQFVAADGVAARVEVDAFGAVPRFTCVRYDGTNASRTTLQANDEVCSLNAFGYNGTAVVGPQAAFRTYAAQNWSVGANGTYADIAVTPNGSTTLTESVRFENSGGVTVPATVTGGDPGAGKINAGGLQVNGVAVIAPAPTRAGDVPYWTGSAWATLAGNNSGTNCFSENASGVPSWATCGGGGTTSPGGATTNVQYNLAGAFAGDANFLYNSLGKITLGATASGNTGAIDFKGGTNGTVSVAAPASGASAVVTLPTGSGTIPSVGIAPVAITGAGAVTCTTCTTTLASGTVALGTSLIAANSCGTAATATATGVASTDIVDIGWQGDPTAITGYTPTASVTLYAYFSTTNTVAFKQCNFTASGITPAARTVNWSVRR